ncbi:unnamed protein product [Ranitomeya imitator]|uniref:ubiquitinyl hydrolase 1 n=1 Tax=Ranitomeya imitator TaxID=111125 RepID=A0ABN9KX26_9NEOB|nr:unnamed protein product [Ranitomeya imitator]
MHGLERREEQRERRRKHQQTFINQLREITGINDLQVLQHALKESNGNLELAVAFLTANNAKLPQPEEGSYYQTAIPNNDRYISVGSQADTNVIDLTGDDKDDLQRAIALSLEESNRTFRETGITDEEQAISRVLEASIAENKASLKRTHTEVWSDSPNPYDRKRQDNCPVGLKNVGNTCWFSAVIQVLCPLSAEVRVLVCLAAVVKDTSVVFSYSSPTGQEKHYMRNTGIIRLCMSLFNLLEFRRLVLNYSPPVCAQDVPRNHKDGNQGKHRVTKRGPALSYPMFTLVTGIVGRWRAVCVTALQRPNSDAAAIRIVVGIAAASLNVKGP